MSIISMFVTPEERDGIIREFARSRGLAGCLQHRGGDTLYDPVHPSPEHLALIAIAFRTYLFPSDQALPSPFALDAVGCLARSWVTIDMGQLVKLDQMRILQMTMIQASDTAGLPYKPATWMRTLKRRLGRALSYTVQLELSDGSVYSMDDIGYSDGARRLYDDGVLWRQFDATGDYRPSPASPVPSGA